MHPKKVLAYLCIAQAIILGIILTIVSFSTWIEFWGFWGILFNIFLFPIAELAFPFIASHVLGVGNALFYYLHMFIFVFLFWFASWLGDKAELEYENVERLPSTWLWLPPVLLTVIGGVVSAIISQIKYKMGWWEFILGSIFLLVIYSVLEQTLPTILTVLCEIGILVIFIIAIWRGKRKSKLLGKIHPENDD